MRENQQDLPKKPRGKKPGIDINQAIDPMEQAETTDPETAKRQRDDETITRLATLSPLDYDRVRVAEAQTLEVRPGTLDKLVWAARKAEQQGCEQTDIFPVADPWPDDINPAELLNDIAAVIRRFIVCNPETSDAASLWVTMTWFIDVVQVAPLAIITAPEKRCGKSQLLFILGRLVNRPLAASNITPAALFRSIDLWSPTLLIDEADAFIKDNEELRGLLNCGHTRDSAYIIRTVGDAFTPTRFNVWGAKALAGIGALADTLMDRAVALELRRKMSHEAVDRLRHAEPDLFDVLTSKLARFADDYRQPLRLARPHLPPALHDRAQDNWEPLLAIADIAGNDWPQRAVHAALKLSGAEGESLSVGVELLADIKELFDNNRADKISTADLITALCDDDEKPWSTYNRGKPITPRQISKRLGEYGIKSKTVRIGYATHKGFELDQFKESFGRYLTVSPLLSVTTSQTTAGAGSSVTDKNTSPSHENLSVTTSQTVTDKKKRYLNENRNETDNQLNNKDCYLVTFSEGENGKNHTAKSKSEDWGRI